MINFEDKVLEYIDYGRLTFLSEHKIFTRFLQETIESDNDLANDEVEELLNVLNKAMSRLDDYEMDVEDYKTLCWEKFDEHYQDRQRLSAYYRVLVVLFYEFTDEVDRASQFTEIGLFLDCLDVIDEKYPQIFYQKFIHDYNDLIEIL